MLKAWLQKRSLQFNTQRAKAIFAEIRPYLQKKNKVIDIGCGTCCLDEILIKHGFNLAPVDIKDHSLIEHIKPLIYDGERLPFPGQQFDIALLVTVLHHTSKPETLLIEAGRMARKLIVKEDIYTNQLEKWLTFAMDSVINVEYWGHPHSNKSDIEWKRTFDKLGWKLVDAKYGKFWGIFRGATYYLER